MMRHLDFVKYQGCGNDFVIVDEMDGNRTDDGIRSKLAKRVCDRHFGVGADGLIFVEPREGCDGSMRLFESAGNEADMCGNGLRCVASFISYRNGNGKDTMLIMTRDGAKEVTSDGELFTADMGPVRTRRKHLAEYVTDPGDPDDSMLEFTIECCGARWSGSILNTGEPHIVIFGDDISSVDLTRAGTEVNSDRARFPKNVNVNFAQKIGPDTIGIRTYEREIFEETMACGTGATACAAAAVMKEVVGGSSVTVETRGGPLVIRLTADGRALMTGPAVRVFSGSVDVDC